MIHVLLLPFIRGEWGGGGSGRGHSRLLDTGMLVREVDKKPEYILYIYKKQSQNIGKFFKNYFHDKLSTT